MKGGNKWDHNEERVAKNGDSFLDACDKGSAS